MKNSEHRTDTIEQQTTKPQQNKRINKQASKQMYETPPLSPPFSAPSPTATSTTTNTITTTTTNNNYQNNSQNSAESEFRTRCLPRGGRVLAHWVTARSEVWTHNLSISTYSARQPSPRTAYTVVTLADDKDAGGDDGGEDADAGDDTIGV